MLTTEEQKFVDYWEANRLQKKKVVTQLAVGLPLAVALAVAIIANFLSGWYKRADMTLRTDSSTILVVIVGAVLIVLFITIFSARHRWEMNEQLYRELLSKKNRS